MLLLTNIYDNYLLNITLESFVKVIRNIVKYTYAYVYVFNCVRVYGDVPEIDDQRESPMSFFSLLCSAERNEHTRVSGSSLSRGLFCLHMWGHEEEYVTQLQRMSDMCKFDRRSEAREGALSYASINDYTALYNLYFL